MVRERDERVEACDRLAAERQELGRQCDGLSKENGTLRREAADLRTTVTKEQEKFSQSLVGERGRPEEVAGSGGGQVPGRSVRSVDGDRRGEEEHPGSLFSDVIRLKTVT